MLDNWRGLEVSLPRRWRVSSASSLAKIPKTQESEPARPGTVLTFGYNAVLPL